MALRDAINDLGKQTPQYKAMVLAGVLLGLGAIYYQFWYSDLDDQKGSLESRRTMQLDKQRKLAKDIEDQKLLAQKNDELQRIIRDNQKALPTEAELPAFFDHLQRKAGDAGVTIRRWEQRPEEDVDIYIRVPVDMEVSGTFYNIMKYYALLGPHHNDPLMNAANEDDDKERVDERIVSIENLDLGGSSLLDGEVVLVAKFTASTFRQLGEGDRKAAGKGKKAKGRKRGAK